MSSLFSGRDGPTGLLYSMSDLVVRADKAEDFEWRRSLERRVDLASLANDAGIMRAVASRSTPQSLAALVDAALSSNAHRSAAELAVYGRGLDRLPDPRHDDLLAAKTAFLADETSKAAALRFSAACLAAAGERVAAAKDVADAEWTICAATQRECDLILAAHPHLTLDVFVTDDPASLRRQRVAVSVACSALEPSSSIEGKTALDDLISVCVDGARWLCWCGTSPADIARLSSSSRGALVDAQGRFAGAARLLGDDDSLDLVLRDQLTVSVSATRCLLGWCVPTQRFVVDSVIDESARVDSSASVSGSWLDAGSRIGARAVAVGLRGVATVDDDVEARRLPLVGGSAVVLSKRLDDDLGGRWWLGRNSLDVPLENARLFRRQGDDGLVSIREAIRDVDVDALARDAQRRRAERVRRMLAAGEAVPLALLRGAPRSECVPMLEDAAERGDLVVKARCLSQIAQLYHEDHHHGGQEESCYDFEEDVMALFAFRRALLDRAAPSCRIAAAYFAASKAAVRRAVARETVSKQRRQPAQGAFRATAPARIDLGGGWTDTPPLAYEVGGAVANVAVKIDGKRPVGCDARLRSDGIVFLESGDSTATVRSAADLEDRRDPNAACALLKCCVVVRDVLGLGIHLRTWSLLPQGSGLGTSSILAACALAAIDACLGVTEIDRAELVEAVARVEQELTTAGGYQDNVGGVYAGAKLSTSPPSLPLAIRVDPIECDATFVNSSLRLAYTGTCRLAKNLLDNVLKRWHARRPDVVDAATRLVHTATDAGDALRESDRHKLGATLDEYWRLKKVMAADDERVEPPNVSSLLAALRPHILGASLCGAGGGGFLAFVPADASNLPDFHSHDLRVYTPTLDTDGLCVDKLQHWPDCAPDPL